MKKVFTVNGMACMHCAARVENTLKGLAGVNGAQVNLDGKCVEVEYDEAQVDAAAMKQAVDAAGYEFVAE